MKVQDMLLRGYFPIEMPPAFSTKDFGNAAPGLRASIPKKEWTRPVEFNLARPGSLRRRLGIPNPFSQLELLRQCTDEWATLKAHVAKSSISLSRPQIAPTDGMRALEFRVPFADRSSERLSRMWRGRFTVRADISDFYGSVYTHSLEWALHTKTAAKQNLVSKGPKLLGGRIDDAVRNGQDGQTKGIPVGPDTSLLMAELILCEIDSELQKLMPQSALSAIRMVDDLEFYAKTRAEAEEFLTAWDSLLHGYDLSLNPRKTMIFEGPVPPEMPWRVHLSQFRLRSNTDAVLARDIQSYFSRAFELARDYSDDSVLGYAINRVRWLPMEKRAWEAFQYSMLASVTAEPSSLRFVSPIFAAAVTSGRELDRDLISETLNQMCWYHAPFEHGSEVAWSLNLLRMIGLPVDSDVADRIARMQDNASLLLMSDFVSRHAVSGPLPDLTSVKARAEDPLAYRSEDWLLGYESARNGWSDPAYFVAQSHWNELLKAKVEFFRAAQPVLQKIATVAPSAAPKPGAGGVSAVPKPGAGGVSAVPKPGAGGVSAAPKAAQPKPWSNRWSSLMKSAELDPIIEEGDYYFPPGEFY